MTHRHRFRSGGLAAWSIGHPVGVTVITLAIVVLGVASLTRLGINLLPELIYPDIRVRIMDPGVPVEIMEDRITRQLEEQLAITEDAISVQSETSEGRSGVDLSFSYGKDIDIALRDASTRLDRAKRFLPDTIDPPVIYKRDPSQIPILEFVVSSTIRNAVELREWVDYVFSKWFINLPGVAAAEVGGGLIREIHVLPDQQRMAGLGITMDQLAKAIAQGNVEAPGGKLLMPAQQMSSRTQARFESVEQLADLPIITAGGEVIYLRELARVLDSHEDEELRVRLNGESGVKVSIQKQPQANTVAVVDAVNTRIQWLQEENLLPEDISIAPVSDQAVFVRHSMNNAVTAAISGAILAMIVVYLFLGSVRRTLVIGTAIPIAVVVAFIIMEVGGLTLNIMTLGGLALGVGMLVDNTIVMLENIYRHQREGERPEDASVHAAQEVNSAIVASTSTNLAAVLPFLFIGGLVGLLFKELIFTITAAIIASLLVALTLVPAYSSRIVSTQLSPIRERIDAGMLWLRERYTALVRRVIAHPLPVILVFVVLFVVSVPALISDKETFLPKVDEGQVYANVTADPGISLEQMDEMIADLEAMLLAQPEVETVFSTVGGRIFGRSQYSASNKSSVYIQLVPRSERDISVDKWAQIMTAKVAKKQIAGFRIHMRSRGVRGIRIGRGDEEVSLRVQGNELDELAEVAAELVSRLKKIDGLRNIKHSSEEVNAELAMKVDRVRAAALGLSPDDVGRALNFALQGRVVSEFLQGDRGFDIRLRLPARDIANPQDLENILLMYHAETREPIYIRDVASVELIASPVSILRDQQRRIVEVSAALQDDFTLGAARTAIAKVLEDFPLPQGVTVYDAGAAKALQEGRQLGGLLLALALFLVFVVMAVQYESVRNPFVILLSVPFALTGVASGLFLTDIPVSMPVWLGLIMLAGIVVNNAIVFVEYIELGREKGIEPKQAIIDAAHLRLRPILMTTLTTVVGMFPLALGWGEGAEMLQPLAVTIVSGLLFSLLVSLFLVPVMYKLLVARVRAA